MTDPPTEAFAAACRFRGPLRFGISDAMASSRDDYYVERPYAVVGRDVHSDLVIDHWLVSKKHVYFQAIAGRIYAIDLGSRAGLKWASGMAAHGWADVPGGLQLGPHTVSVADGLDGRDDGKPPAWTPLAAQADDPETPLSVRIEPLELGEAFAPKRINRPITLVGRAPGCRVRIDHPSVSNFHCALVSVSDQLWMVDLLGRDGVRVNGELTRHARLMADDVLRIGSHNLRILEGSSNTPPPRVVGKALRRRDSQALIGRVAFPATSNGLQTYIEPAVSRTPARMEPAEELDVRAVLEQFGTIQSQMLDQFYQAMMTMMKFQQEAHQGQISQMKGETEQLRDLVRELHAMKAIQAAPSPAPPVAPPPAAPMPPHPHFAPEPAPQPAAEPAPPRQAKATQPADAKTQSVDDIQDWLAKRFDTIQGEQQGRWRKLFDSVIGQSGRPVKGERT
ncbi:FHA domain-containing protein [Isosphaeraceae bacterium EP7]